MQPTQINGAFSSIEKVKLIRYAPLLLSLLLIIGIVIIAFRVEDLLTRLAFIIALVGCSIFAIRKDVWFLASGFQVLVKGEAQIEVNIDGFLLKRRHTRELYPWNTVQSIRLCSSPEETKTEYEIEIELKNGRDIIVTDDRSWTNFQAMRSWSKGYFDAIGWKSQTYDSQKNEFVDSSGPA